MVRPENDPAARMRVLSRGELLAPAACMICGSSTHDRGYLDIGVFYDYEGQQYLCMECAYQAGETVGLFTPDEVKHLQLLTQQQAELVADQEEELKYARPIVAVFTSAIESIANGDSVPTVAAGENSKGSNEQHEVGYRRSDATPSGTDGGESGTKESTTEPGRSDPDQPELQYASPEQPTLD